jgi:hypothetical protein
MLQLENLQSGGAEVSPFLRVTAICRRMKGWRGNNGITGFAQAGYD